MPIPGLSFQGVGSRVPADGPFEVENCGVELSVRGRDRGIEKRVPAQLPPSGRGQFPGARVREEARRLWCNISASAHTADFTLMVCGCKE